MFISVILDVLDEQGVFRYGSFGFPRFDRCGISGLSRQHFLQPDMAPRRPGQLPMCFDKATVVTESSQHCIGMVVIRVTEDPMAATSLSPTYHMKA